MLKTKTYAFGVREGTEDSKIIEAWIQRKTTGINAPTLSRAIRQLIIDDEIKHQKLKVQSCK